MPISFIVLGVVYIAIVFNDTKSLQLVLLSSSLLFVLVSYFWGEIIFSYISFNIVGVVGIVFFLLFLCKSFTPSLSLKFAIFFFWLFSYFIFKHDQYILVEYDILFILIIIIISHMCCHSIFSRMFCTVLLSLGGSLMNSVILIINYSYAFLDIFYIYNCLATMVVLCFLEYCIKKYKRGVYEKDFYFNNFLVDITHVML